MNILKNLIVHGLVLASDGTKMSKRKKNYPDPIDIANKYGADALRLYLITSPVVRGENLKFREEGVRDMLKDALIPWFNAYRFFVQNALSYEKEKGGKFTAKLMKSDNILDRWILSFTNSLVAFVKEEMAAYRLYTVVPRLVKYVEVLTNWFVRLNRKRLKGDNGEEEWLASLETLYHVLAIMVRLMAPFTPFITEHMWQNLRHSVDPKSGLESTESVHYLMLPPVEEELIDEQVEKRVAAMQAVIDLARITRERHTLPLKYPVKEMVVIHRDPVYLKEVERMESYILEEVNARKESVIYKTRDRKF